MKRFYKNKIVYLMLLVIVTAALVLSGCGETSSTAGNNSEQNQKGFPNKPITLIVTHDVGGGVDTSARGIQPYLEKTLGVPVVVENKPGAGGLVAMNYVAAQKPDGYTLLVGSVPSTMLKQLLSPQDAKFEYSDFVPIAAWNNEDADPFMVSADSPYKTWEEFVKANKDKKVNLGISGGMGSSDHVAWVLLKKATGIDFVPVPFDSAAEALTAVQGGHIDAAIASVATAAAMIKDNRVRALAITSANRVSVLPEVPTFIELGLPDVWVEFHVGAFAPRGTPSDIAKILSDAFYKAAQDPEFKEWAQKVGVPIGDPLDGEGWKAYIQKEYERLKSLIPELKANPLG